MPMTMYEKWSGGLLMLADTDSTNSEALRLVRAGHVEEFAVCSDQQSAGRGRLERAWASDVGLGLYCSIACRPQVESKNMPQLTLLTAVAAYEAVMQTCGVKLAIKWPNDLYYDNRKVGGILAEMHSNPFGNDDVVIVGVGINLNHQRSDFPDMLQDNAVSLAMLCGQTVERDALLANFLDTFHSYRTMWEQQGFAAIRTRWLELDCTVGKRVTIPGKTNEKAIVIGIDAEGSLLLKNDAGKSFSVIADDVSF